MHLSRTCPGTSDRILLKASAGEQWAGDDLDGSLLEAHNLVVSGTITSLTTAFATESGPRERFLVLVQVGLEKKFKDNQIAYYTS